MQKPAQESVQEPGTYRSSSNAETQLWRWYSISSAFTAHGVQRLGGAQLAVLRSLPTQVEEAGHIDLGKVAT